MIKDHLKPLLFIFTLLLTFQVWAQTVADDKKAHDAMNAFLDAEKHKLTEDYSRAVTLYRKTLEIDPAYDPAMYELSRLLIYQQNYSEALLWMEKAWNLDPNNKWYGLLLVDLYRNNYQIKEASGVMEKLMALEPNNTDYLLTASGFFSMLENYGKAQDCLLKIESIDGISEKSRLQMKNLYLQQKEFDKAVNTMIELSDAFPYEEKYCSMIAEMYMQAQKTEEALRWYEKVLKINPNNPYIQITLADYYAKLNNTDKAFEYLKEGYSNPSLDIDTKVQILANYLESGKYQDALKSRTHELARILVGTHPDSPKSHAIYGDILFNDSLYAEAAVEFEKVIILDSTHFAVWNQLLYSLSLTQENEKAASFSLRAMEQFPEMEFPYYVNALANFQLGNYPQIISSLEQGLYFVVNQDLKEQFYMLLGDACHEQGEAEKAYMNYEKCLEINPENAFVLNNYAYYLSLENRELERAEQMAKKAVELSPNENNLDTYGWVLFQLGKYELALNYIQQSMEQAGNPSAVILEHMGDVYWKLGDGKQARHYWKKAKKAGGVSKELEGKLKDN